LEQAWDLADRLHPELAAAQARIEAAEGRAAQAGTIPNPALSARLESAPFRGSATGDAETIAGVTQNLPVGGRLGAASRVEDLERARLAAESEARRSDVRARVHAAFAAALYAGKASLAARDALELAESGVAVARARHAAGDALPEDVARAELEAIRAQAEAEQAESLAARAGIALAAAMGGPSVRIESTEGDLDQALDIPTLESLLGELDRTPFVASAEAAVEVERGRLDLAKAQRIPDVDLGLFYRRIGPEDANAFDVGLGVTLPIFDRREGQIRAAEADIRAARAGADAVRNERERDLRDAHARLSQAVVRANLFREEVLPKAQTVLQAAEARYAAGDIGLAEVLPVRRDHTEVRLAHLAALRDAMEAWSDLKLFIRNP
jgi:cobalt-zinc-cadmium efflux system outer membrane protein